VGITHQKLGKDGICSYGLEICLWIDTNRHTGSSEYSTRGRVRISVAFIVPFAFSALTLLVGQQEGHPACKKQQTCILPSRCHCHSLSLASVKSRLVSPFWYRLTRVVPDKRPLNVCVCVCVCVCVRAYVRTSDHKFSPAIPVLCQEDNIKISEHCESGCSVK